MAQKTQRRFWSTVEQYENEASADALKTEEFYSKPENAMNEDLSMKDSGEHVSSTSRRDFLKLSGMATVFSMVACSERPVQKILPYVNAPEEVIPGVANYYASSSDESASGVVVKTREGRPVQIMANDLDTFAPNGINGRGHASIYDLYDPARAKHAMKLDRKGNGTEIDYADAYAEIANAIKAGNGKVVLLTGTLTGPTRKRVVDEFVKTFPSAEHVVVDATTNDQFAEATKLAFNTENAPHYRFDRADLVVSFGGDIGDGRDAEKYAQGIAKKRDVLKRNDMSRLYAFEPTMTEFGMSADYRYKVRNDQMADVAFAVAHQLVSVDQVTSYTNDNDVRNMLAPYSPSSVEKRLGLKGKTIQKVAKELWANRGKSVVYAEGSANKTVNGVALHLATHFLNTILGNVGETIDFEYSYGKQDLGSFKSLVSLIADMKSGNVSAVFTYKTNPSYFLPNASEFNGALAKVKTVVSLDDRITETGKHADYLLPTSHSLESWVDREFINGKYTVVQPTISPLWNTRQFEESLMHIATVAGSTAFVNKKGAVIDSYDLVRMVWKDMHKALKSNKTFDRFWIDFVRDGVVDTISDREASHKAYAFNTRAFNGLKVETAAKGLTLSVFVGSQVHDGSQNNNPYLLECPDPVSKVTWDNFLAVSNAFAKQHNLEITNDKNDLVEIEVGGTRHVLPFNIQPGQRDDVVTVAAGWGRTSGGLVADGDQDADGNYLGQGFNAFQLTANGVYSGIPVKFVGKAKQYKATYGDYRLANTQGHQHMDDSFRTIEIQKEKHHDENYRPIVFETTLNEYKEDPTKAVHHHTKELTRDTKNETMLNMWNNSRSQVHEYPGHRWGMAIDLNKCTGCNACIIACQVENNIPVVGKAEVLRGREMHWIRIDRYYVGDEQDPDVINQPMMCQHCENAPCETVCPVVATTHNAEGLNVMTYNRCVGTRYCANNCPYKVRRFNFHEYTSGNADKGWPQIGLGTREGLDQKGYEPNTSPLQLMFNPDVTVREKGVMEKCTMCNHRIREIKYEAKMQGKSVNELQKSIACHEGCSADAIVFGDLNDPNSDVAKLQKKELAFMSLGELNTLPSVSYIARVRNQDEKLHVADDSSKENAH